MGLVTALARDREDLTAQAQACIAAHPKARQPWDAPKFRFPGGDSRAPALAQMWAVAPSMASAKSQGNCPAVKIVMSAVFEGGLLDFDNASMVESRYFAACAMSAESRNLIGTLWYQLNAIRRGASRPAGVPAFKVRKLGVLGAGMMGAGAVFASNTSTLPITGLAQDSVRPERFLGLHFFSPADKMPLVENIKGQQTGDEALARGFDFVQQIGKTPIVVNDSRGFFTSRVFATYLMEGICMLAEGVHPRSIEAAGMQAGMPSRRCFYDWAGGDKHLWAGLAGRAGLRGAGA